MSRVGRVVEEVRDNMASSRAVRAYKKYAKKNQGVININNSSMDKAIDMLDKSIDIVTRDYDTEDEFYSKSIASIKAEQELVLKSNELIESAIQIVTELGLITNPIELTINYDSKRNRGCYSFVESPIRRKKGCHSIYVDTCIGSLRSALTQEYKDDNDFLITINKIYGVNIDPTNKENRMLVTFLHEFGHYYDYVNGITETDTKVREKKLNIMNDFTAEDIAIIYRQMPDEAYADRFAIDILKRYYPEILYSNK